MPNPLHSVPAARKSASGFGAVCLIFTLLALTALPSLAAEKPAVGVPVTYELPTEGSLPRTYLVTLAIVEAKNPDWIISQFACGVARTVTRENGGKFSEVWDGLDDNFMPVPPGDYAVKGIFSPANQWRVDGEWHAVTPKFTTAAVSWAPSPDDWKLPLPFSGDPVDSPMGDIAVGPNGVAVFYYRYLENGKNNPMLDLKKPVGYDQFIRAFTSGGAGGGDATATDGETVWSYANEGGPKYVYRADQKSFGKSESAQRKNGYLVEGRVTSMAAWRDGEKSFVAVAQRGKMVAEKGERHTRHVESETEKVDKITLHDGDDGKILGELALPRPQSVTVQKGVLYALHADGAGWAIGAVPVGAGVAKGAWQRFLTIPKTITPADMEVDSRGRIYVSDTKANHVYQFDKTGKVLATFGKLDAQRPGTYDPLTLMGPTKLATWVDPEGQDRLLILENAGPNRVAEWTPDGKLLREFLNLQTKANSGWTVDPEKPEHVYIPGHEDWLVRFRVDYEKRVWTVDAVWPLRDDPRARDLRKPKLINVDGRKFLAGTAGSRENSFNIYRLADDGWKLSASLLRVETDPKTRKMAHYFWHDANNNGRVDDDELTPHELPGRFFTYHGQNWNAELSFLAMDQGGQNVWQLAPSGFDPHGNPIFQEWKKLLTDPIFVARTEGKAAAAHGGNELADNYSSDWMQTDGTAAEGFVVQARGGKGFSANEGAQYKVSRYVPDGAGGFNLKWRTGRTALQGNAKPGEIYGAMRIQKPINGLIPVVDQSRCGVLLYNEDGLYVDTVFLDGRKFRPDDAGVYPQPGEFFAGFLFPSKTNGKIYFGMGKYTPMIFEAEGWSLKENPAKPITTVQKKVTIASAQIATPPEIALSLRGGAGGAKFARFAPALGGAVMDGSMSGWESCEPVTFQAAKDQTVEVRCLYDPEHLYLRWHARLPTKFAPKPLPPLERIFTHDQGADTLSFYVQGDVNAKPSGSAAGRPGDVRFVFGVFERGGKAESIAVGMYPQWTGKRKASPANYRTPVGSVSFGHVGAVEGAQLSHQVDADGKGFVLVAAIPRTAIPHLQQPFAGGLRTLMNFEATLGGHNKFWWANSDGSASRETYDEPTEARLYPGSWAPAEFQGFDDGVVIRNWLICGPFGGPGAEKFNWDPNGKMPGTNKDQKVAVHEFFEAATYPPDDGKVDLKARFTGDAIKGWWPDPKAVGWKPATIEDLDTRVKFGPAAQVWYATSWVHAPAATEIPAKLYVNPQAYPRWSVNGVPVPIKANGYKPDEKQNRRHVVSQTLALRAGWNQISVRTYCTGYSLAAGLAFDGPPEKLWTLKLSGTPPQ